MHYDAEVDDKNATAVADALIDNKLYLAIITPVMHSHFAYGGIASLDANERKAAEELDTMNLMKVLAKRETVKAEDMMRASVVSAQAHFDEMYK